MVLTANRFPLRWTMREAALDRWTCWSAPRLPARGHFRELMLPYLPRRSDRERRQKNDAARPLVGREQLARPGDDLLFRDRSSGKRLHERDHFFVAVRDAP